MKNVCVVFELYYETRTSTPKFTTPYMSINRNKAARDQFKVGKIKGSIYLTRTFKPLSAPIGIGN